MMYALRAAGLLAASGAALGLFALVGATPAMADGLGAGIVGSPHDFTDDTNPDGAVRTETTWNFRAEICRVCHVPHDHDRNADLFAEGLLWNHRLSEAGYVMYDSAHSPTLDNTQDPQPTGIAKLCLSCHDGTVAVDSFDKKAPDNSGTVFMSDIDADFQHPGASIPLVGSDLDLRGTHPISILYDDVDTGLYPPTNPMGFSGSIEDVLEGGKVQCSSCHDVHDEEAIAGTHLLRVSNTAPPSGLCLTCHNKDESKIIP